MKVDKAAEKAAEGSVIPFLVVHGRHSIVIHGWACSILGFVFLPGLTTILIIMDGLHENVGMMSSGRNLAIDYLKEACNILRVHFVHGRHSIGAQ